MPPLKENELVQTNRLLLGLTIAAIVLLGPTFLLGYYSGFRTAKTTAIQVASQDASKLPSPGPAAAEPAASHSNKSKRSKPVQVTTAAEGTGETTEVLKADPTVPRHIYLQLVTTAKTQSASIISTLKNDGFPVIASDVPEKPALHRVLIGPLQRVEIDQMRADLKSKGFPGDAAIVRTF